MDSVISLCIKMGISEKEKQRIGRILSDNVIYHRFVLENHPLIGILDFKTVTGNPLAFLQYIAKELDIKISSEKLNKRLAGAMGIVRKKEKEKSPIGSSMPNESRNRLKKTYTIAVGENPLFAEAMRLHLELISLKSL